MLAVFSNRTYRHLFTAQVIALAGTGLLTVALAFWRLTWRANRLGPSSARLSPSR